MEVKCNPEEEDLSICVRLRLIYSLIALCTDEITVTQPEPRLN